MRVQLIVVLAILFGTLGGAAAQGPLAPTDFAVERDGPTVIPAALGLPATVESPPATSAATEPPAVLGRPADRLWVRGEYLRWTTKGMAVPSLVTGAPATSPAAIPGALGNADTAVLFGNDRQAGSPRSGFRVLGGFWLDECGTAGVDASFFDLCPRHTGFLVSSDGTTTSLFRPIFNTATGRPGVEDVAFLPDGIVGSVGAQMKTSFRGGDLNCRQLLCADPACGEGYRVDWLVGYRALSLTEDLSVTENLTTLDLAGLPNGSIVVTDRFHARNLFQGAQAGLDAEWWRGRCFIGARATVAVGVTRETVEVAGSTTTTPIGGAATVQPGGLLALPTNIGTYHRNQFAFSPALGVRVGYQWTPWLRTSVGYDVTYLNRVVRPGDQIDLAVNPNQVPPALAPPYDPARPAFGFRSADFWAQGVSFAVEVRF